LPAVERSGSLVGRGATGALARGVETGPAKQPANEHSIAASKMRLETQRAELVRAMLSPSVFDLRPDEP